MWALKDSEGASQSKKELPAKCFLRHCCCGSGVEQSAAGQSSNCGQRTAKGVLQEGDGEAVHPHEGNPEAAGQALPGDPGGHPRHSPLQAAAVESGTEVELEDDGPLYSEGDIIFVLETFLR